MKSPVLLAVAVVLSAAVGSCSGSLPEMSSVNLLPRVDQLARPDWITYSGSKEEFVLRPVTPADLVNADGQCPAPQAGADMVMGPDGAPLPVAGGIALQMTECEVVRRGGAPDRVEIGADPRGDRAVVMTYTRGARPGIYRFVAGRLASVDRVPEAPAARAPKAKAKKAAPAPS